MIAGGNHTSVSCREAAKGVSLVTLRCYHSTNSTPSVSPFGLPAPPKGEPRGPLRIRPGFHKGMSAYRETPLRLAKSRLTAVARLHGACASLSQARWACQLPFQGRFSCCPLWGKCREAAKGVSSVTLSCCHSSYHTPSVSLAGSEVPSSLPAPPLGSQVCFKKRRNLWLSFFMPCLRWRRRGWIR